MKTEKTAADDTRSQHKASCRTCHSHCFHWGPLLMLSCKKCIQPKQASECERLKAIPTHKLLRRTRLPSAASWNGALCDFSGKTRHVFLLSSKPLCPAFNSPSLFPLSPLFSSKRLAKDHLLWGQGTTATLAPLGTPYDLEFFSHHPWVTPT